MTRTVSATVTSNTAKVITEPTWLLKLTFSVPIYLTTGKTVSFGGDTYSRKGLKILSMAETSLSFSADNDDNALSAVLSGEGAADIPISLAYYYETAGVVIWTGFLDGARIAKKVVQFRAGRVEAGAGVFPEKHFHRTQFPYLPNDGTVIQWGGVELTLRSR